MTLLLDTLIYASWLFLVALGLTLIFGVLRVLNFAHGTLYAIGAYSGASMLLLPTVQILPKSLLLICLLFVGPIIAVVLGPLIEWALLRRFYGRGELIFLFVTYAMFLVMESAIQIIWGTRPYYATEIYDVFGVIGLGGIVYVGYDFFLVGAAIVLGGGTWFLLRKTTQGKLTQAVIYNADVSELLGVDVRGIKLRMFTFGTALALVAGALVCPSVPVQVGMGINVIVASFAVIVIGGLGSIEGAFIGALIVAFVRTLTIRYMPGLELFIVYLCMLLVLMVRTEGLFPPPKIRVI